MAEQNDAVATAVESLKAAVTALKTQEDAMSTELAAITTKRKAAEKALAAMGDAPRRRRGRPRNADRAPEAVAA